MSTLRKFLSNLVKPSSAADPSALTENDLSNAVGSFDSALASAISTMQQAFDETLSVYARHFIILHDAMLEAEVELKALRRKNREMEEMCERLEMLAGQDGSENAKWAYGGEA